MAKEQSGAEREERHAERQRAQGGDRRRSVSPPAADGLFHVGVVKVLGRALADGAADGSRQILTVQVQPVDDAVLGARQGALQLPGREIGIDAPRERQGHEHRQVGDRG